MAAAADKSRGSKGGVCGVKQVWAWVDRAKSACKSVGKKVWWEQGEVMHRVCAVMLLKAYVKAEWA